MASGISGGIVTTQWSNARTRRSARHCLFAQVGNGKQCLSSTGRPVHFPAASKPELLKAGGLTESDRIFAEIPATQSSGARCKVVAQSRLHDSGKISHRRAATIFNCT